MGVTNWLLNYMEDIMRNLGLAMITILIKYSNCSLPPYPFLPSFSYIPIYRGSKNLKYGQTYI